ncbi:uncharacterized protein [Danio rerio]|uniref:Uncharacterized protein n=1 Tax=Danio rerio TaxID=7955 RepID=A0AC58IHB1_DANRE
MRFVLILLRLRLWHLDGVFGADEDEMKTLSVTEGDSVILHTGVAEMRNITVLQWMFGPENPDIIIAELNREAMINNVSDERFRDRVKMDNQTGSLTFTNIRSTDTGLYKVEISTNPEADKMFRVTVCAFLSAPVIIRNTSKCSSSEGPSVSHCALLCSVVNVSAVSLSWYKGNSLISSISVFNVSIRLSLPLELQYEDNNTYSCVINNTISNKTEHLDIRQHCQPCAGQGPEEEITYAEPTFCKRNALIMRVKQEDDLVYAGIVR